MHQILTYVQCGYCINHEVRLSLHEESPASIPQRLFILATSVAALNAFSCVRRICIVIKNVEMYRSVRDN